MKQKMDPKEALHVIDTVGRQFIMEISFLMSPGTVTVEVQFVNGRVTKSFESLEEAIADLAAQMLKQERLCREKTS